jgi:cell shape-determining protein MreD
MQLHRRNEASRSAIIRRIIVYGISFFILGIAQCSFFTNLSFISFVPDIVMGAVAAVSLLDSQRSAIICSIAAGAMIDALGGSGLSLSPIAFLVIALIVSEISKKILPSFISWLVILVPSALIKAIFTLFNIYFATGELSLFKTFEAILLPEFILTVLLSLPIYYVMKLCVKIIEQKSKFKV